jgi:hypothetical protein
MPYLAASAYMLRMMPTEPKHMSVFNSCYIGRQVFVQFNDGLALQCT